MTTFFPADDGYHYPLSSIERFKMTFNSPSDPILTVDLTTIGGSSVTVTGRGADIILRGSSNVIPAAPGTFYVGMINDEKPKWVWLQPVIAWVIPTEREPLPLTIHGIEGGVENPYVIRMPNGSIADYGMGDHPDLATYLRTIDFSDDEIGAAQIEEQQALKRLS